MPEFLFFGADESRAKLDWSAWPEFDKVLHAPKGWGSYAQWSDVKNPVDRLRLVLRRHLGLVANNAGVYLQDQGRDEEAFDFYERVLNEIDSDNVCALFNEIELAGAKNARAVAKRPELERRLRQIADDKARRYAIWRLASYYGYIRNPDMFVRLGYTWARSGRPGDALAQIRRAIDFVPQEKQNALLNMMAALYANENDQAKSRSIYESVLAKDGQDHDALIGMMRLKLLEGDQKAALDYLQRATAASSDGGRMAQIELSMVSMMKGDLKGAKSTLAKLADDNPKDLQAWSLLAGVLLQQADQELDATKFQTIQVKWDEFRTEPTDLNSANAIGLNLYGTQVTGTITFDYIKGIKADGSTEIIDDFDKKPGLEGTASGKVVALGGTGDIGSNAIRPVRAASSKMLVSVRPGSVTASFSAATAGMASATLMNTMGQVIDQQNFTANKGANSVELLTNYRGPAMLLVKQGSVQYVQKVILK